MLQHTIEFCIALHGTLILGRYINAIPRSSLTFREISEIHARRKSANEEG